MLTSVVIPLDRKVAPCANRDYLGLNSGCGIHQLESISHDMRQCSSTAAAKPSSVPPAVAVSAIAVLTPRAHLVFVKHLKVTAIPAVLSIGLHTPTL